eukprot:2273643-Amphidinium_carterae.2
MRKYPIIISDSGCAPAIMGKSLFRLPGNPMAHMSLSPDLCGLPLQGHCNAWSTPKINNTLYIMMLSEAWHVTHLASGTSRASVPYASCAPI